MLPTAYLLAIALPQPLGRGLVYANDFSDHRIWWTQVDTFFLAHGFFPQWNPTFDLGYPYVASGFGGGSLYPLRWWTYLPTYFGGAWSYAAQYVQVALHAGLALVGCFLVLTRFGHFRLAPAALATTFVLANQNFNNMLRFPGAVEDYAWSVWALYFALAILSAEAEPGAFRPDKRTGATVLGLSVALGLSWLTAYGQFTVVFLLVIAILATTLVRRTRQVVWLGIGVLVGMAAAVGAIYPSLEWVRSDALRNGANISNINTVSIYGLWDVVSNPFGLDVHYNYFTYPFVFLLVVIGVLVAFIRRRFYLSLGMFLALLVVCDISRGQDGFLFVPMYEHVPFFGAFNSPSKDMWVAFVPMAWFSAQALEWLDGRPRGLRVLVLVPFVGLAAWLCVTYVPHLTPPDTNIWRPLERQWLTPDSSTLLYRTLLVIGAVLLVVWVLVSSAPLRAVVAVAAVFVFAHLFAPYTSWFSADLAPAAALPTTGAFPSGLLAPRLDAYVGIAGVGVVAPNIDPHVWDLLVTHGQYVRGDPQATFPDSRFWWIPQQPGDTAALSLVSAGPNHLTFDIDSQGPGQLEYLAKYSPKMQSNVPFARDPQTGEFYVFSVQPGVAEISLEFSPIDYLVVEVISCLGIFGLVGAWIVARWWRPRLALVCLVIGVAAAAWLLYGSLTRHSLPSQVLFGGSGVTPGVYEPLSIHTPS